jgi:hypothetical protein
METLSDLILSFLLLQPGSWADGGGLTDFFPDKKYTLPSRISPVA